VSKQRDPRNDGKDPRGEKEVPIWRFQSRHVALCKNITPKHQIGYLRLLAVKGRMEKKSERPVKKEEGPPTAALRYGFFIEFLSPSATADLKRSRTL